MTTPRNLCEPKDQEFKRSEGSKNKKSLRRKEAGHRPIVAVDIAHPPRVKPDPAAAEAEAWRVAEASARTRIVELTAGTINPKIVGVNQTIGCGEKHRTDVLRIFAELTLHIHDDLACPADRATAMPDAELASDNKDVAAILLLDDSVVGGNSMTVPTEPIHLLGTKVVELAVARLRKCRKHLRDFLAVILREELRPDDRERPFDPARKLERRVHLASVADCAVGIEVRPVQTQGVDLRLDVRRLIVAREVAEARRHFLILELVGQTVLGDEFRDELSEAGRVVDALCLLVGEARLVVGRPNN